jgi:cellulase/cellobiase CelA1
VAGMSATPSFTDPGLEPATTYRYQVRASNTAGVSPVSATVTATTNSTSTGGCTATATVQSEWDQGYVIQVEVAPTGGPITGWAITFTLPAGHQLVNFWNAIVEVDGQVVTARNGPHNGNLSPGQVAGWGFQASRPSGSGLPPEFTCTATS